MLFKIIAYLVMPLVIFSIGVIYCYINKKKVSLSFKIACGLGVLFFLTGPTCLCTELPDRLVGGFFVGTVLTLVLYILLTFIFGLVTKIRENRKRK